MGNTITVPLHGAAASRAVERIAALGLATTAIATRAPNLDDVYLQLTGARLEAA